VVGEPLATGVCHCSLCKRGTGSAFRVGAFFSEGAVEFIGAARKTYEYRSDESNRWAKLEFCSNCGTSVTWTAEWVPGIRGITVGTLDDPNWLKPTRHVWTRSALHWVMFPDNVQIFEKGLA
jgi:hypothetical protein